MDFSQFLSWSYYFSHAGLEDFQYLQHFLIFSVGMIAAGLILSFIRGFFIKNKNTKKLWRPFSKILIWFGITALFLTWMRYEAIPYLSLRLWWPIYDLSLLFALYVTIKSVRLKAAIHVKKANTPLRKEDPYLPKNRKRPNRKR